MHVIGVPLHWGFTGQARKGYGANTLTPSVGDANTQTPEFKAFLVNIEKASRSGSLRERPMSDLQSQDYIRRSAIDLDAAVARSHEQQVAKLIDVTRCIGCKACQSACMEWNNLRPKSDISRAPTTIRWIWPRSLDADAFHRMGEREGQSGVADPQGRLHALRGSRLPEGLPGARRDRAVCQRHRRLHQRRTASAAAIA